MMFIKLRKLFLRHFMMLSWHSLLVILVVYIAVSWFLLKLCNEHALTGSDFIYWMVVTASTVGYGDLSPSTEAGKWITAIIIVPFGLSLFALTVGRLAAFASYHWRKGVRGLSNINIHDHIVIIGWNGQRTHRLLQLLINEEEYADVPRPIALCIRSDREVENPMPDIIEFVKVSSFNDKNEMDRVSIASASCIVIDNDFDDVTMTAALFCHSRNPSAHIIVYFADESLSELLSTHCPGVECAPSVSVEMLVKAAVDPGSSKLHHELLSVDQGMTQYSVRYPDSLPPVAAEKLFLMFKMHYHATFIALANNSSDIIVNPALGIEVRSGAILYYIADDRITSFNWEKLNT